MLISSIIREIEKYAPRSLQEKWDNTGVQVGTTAIECTGVLICFDVTPAVVEEAIERDCNLIISHHPLFFHGVKRLSGETPQQVCAINAIGAGITIYSSHTAADSTRGGVSYTLAEMLGVQPMGVLDALADRMVHLRVYVPQSHLEEVRSALFDAGAGCIGDYDRCSFTTNGYGTFRALDGADPFIGVVGETTEAAEVALDMVLTSDVVGRVESALLEAHPYETPAYNFTPMLNRTHGVGLGVYGVTDDNLTAVEFIEKIKAVTGAPVVRTTTLPDPDVKIRRVALCGGAGHEYIDTALSHGAQVYISADFKYHDFVDYQDKILLVDAGHYETEATIKQVFLRIITEKFPDFKAVYTTQLKDNPINYI